MDALDLEFIYDHILDYDTEDGISGRHWHPEDTAEALKLVVAFMEGTI